MNDLSPYDAAKLMSESERDGWQLGYIGVAWPGPWPKLSGDLFVADPNGWQAGIAWESKGPDLLVIQEASPERWGVFQVRFDVPVMSEADLIVNFHRVLPLLQRQRSLAQS